MPNRVSVSLDYVKRIENAMQILTSKLYDANCYNTDFGLSNELDYVITHMRLITDGLSKIVKNPSQYQTSS